MSMSTPLISGYSKVKQVPLTFQTEFILFSSSQLCQKISVHGWGCGDKIASSRLSWWSNSVQENCSNPWWWWVNFLLTNSNLWKFQIEIVTSYYRFYIWLWWSKIPWRRMYPIWPIPCLFLHRRQMYSW